MALHWSIKNVKDWYKVSNIILDARIVKRDDQLGGSWILVRKGDKDFKPELMGGRDYIMKFNCITDSIINKCMVVGMRGITKKNHIEFYNRCRMISMKYGADFSSGNSLTLEDIRQHIGLETNVSNTSWRNFISRHFGTDEKTKVYETKYSATWVNREMCIDYFNDEEWDYDYDEDEGRIRKEKKS